MLKTNGKVQSALWQGEEFAENYFLPESGVGRVAMLRPMRWDMFYDTPGQRIIRLIRKLCRIRRDREHIRNGQYYFFNDWNRYQSKGLLLFARYTESAYTLIAINTTDFEQTVPFWFPVGGDYIEEIEGGRLTGIAPLTETQITIPSNYGRIWSSA